MRLARIILSLLTVAAIGASAFFGVRLLMDRFAADDGGVVTAQEGAGGAGEGLLPPEGLSPPAELVGPPFEGELLGIFIGPDLQSQDVVLDTYIMPGAFCPPDTSSVRIPWEQAGEMNLDLGLPPEYELKPYSENTGAYACGETVPGTIRHYELRRADGGSADIFIGRSRLRLAQYTVTAGQVRTAVFAGREAVVIEPAFPDGRRPPGVVAGTRSGVFFPESFGMTFINASALPTKDLRELAELVAEATKR